MAFQSVPNTAEITILFSQNGEPLANTLHAIKPGGYNQGDITALAILVDVAVGANLLSQMTQDAAYTRTEVRGLNVINDLFSTDNTNTGPGTVVSEGMPNQVTFSIKKNSLQTGRSARGRLYWVGIPKNAFTSDENQLLAAEAQNRVDAIEALRVAIEISVWDAVIVSRVTEGVVRDPGVTFPWVTTTKVNNRVDTQRNRLGK